MRWMRFGKSFALYCGVMIGPGETVTVSNDKETIILSNEHGLLVERKLGHSVALVVDDKRIHDLVHSAGR